MCHITIGPKIFVSLVVSMEIAATRHENRNEHAWYWRPLKFLPKGDSGYVLQRVEASGVSSSSSLLRHSFPFHEISIFPSSTHAFGINSPLRPSFFVWFLPYSDRSIYLPALTFLQCTMSSFVTSAWMFCSSPHHVSCGIQHFIIRKWVSFIFYVQVLICNGN